MYIAVATFLSSSDVRQSRAELNAEVEQLNSAFDFSKGEAEFLPKNFYLFGDTLVYTEPVVAEPAPYTEATEE